MIKNNSHLSSLVPACDSSLFLPVPCQRLGPAEQQSPIQSTNTYAKATSTAASPPTHPPKDPTTRQTRTPRPAFASSPPCELPARRRLSKSRLPITGREGGRRGGRCMHVDLFSQAPSISQPLPKSKGNDKMGSSGVCTPETATPASRPHCGWACSPSCRRRRRRYRLRLERRRLDAESARDSSEGATGRSIGGGREGKKWNCRQQLRVVERRERHLQKGSRALDPFEGCRCVVCVAAQSMTSAMQALKASCAYLQASWGVLWAVAPNDLWLRGVLAHEAMAEGGLSFRPPVRPGWLVLSICFQWLFFAVELGGPRRPYSLRLESHGLSVVPRPKQTRCLRNGAG
ncbi:hypothetical protein B0T18DRAFT_160198 [Schizothecium vesticola]|uniref:Uncharacterized protein n=1 Tax=Schizothecium vesticola TaxID=314040 RepID=A0AA40EWF2_9PEZI|nr:hypothetical protein B0T18DRAFT_160198 [Schizothecium vesticola]